MHTSDVWMYLKCAWNAHIALLCYVCKPKSRNVWLIGGTRGELYSDNAKVFYEYLIDTHHSVKPVWIARRGSSAFKLAKGHVIAKGSVKNYLYFLSAQIIVFSDTFNHDIAPGVYLFPIHRSFYNRKYKVRLNHGTISFKKRVERKGLSKFIRDRIMYSYDLTTASTELEESVMNTYTRPNSVVLTGSARNDQVFGAQSAEKYILLAPTWRPWLSKANDFTESEFYFTYKGLLSNPMLIELLRKKKTKLIFNLHHLMLAELRHFGDLSNDVILVEEQSNFISESIVACSLLITDYSSICAERYYLRKPVLFFQFDRKRYSAEVGSYIDLEKDSFGVVATDPGELINRIEFALDDNYQISQQQINGEKYFVHYRDKNNCARIFREIIERASQVDLVAEKKNK